MNFLVTIQVLERFLDVSDETRELYFDLGLKLPLLYKNKLVPYDIDDIENVDDILGCPDESLMILKSGHKIVVLENPDDLYIRILDARSGFVEEN